MKTNYSRNPTGTVYFVAYTWLHTCTTPLLIQTFLLNLVGILAMNWFPDGVNTSWKLFPLPPNTYGLSQSWTTCTHNAASNSFTWTFCSTHLHYLLLLRWLNKIFQNLSSDMLSLGGFWHDSGSGIRATNYSAAIFITVTQSAPFCRWPRGNLLLSHTKTFCRCRWGFDVPRPREPFWEIRRCLI